VLHRPLVGLQHVGGLQLPLVCGHEGVGLVKKVGKDVTSLKLDDRVAIGWMCRSCGDCLKCTLKDEQECFNDRPSLIFSHGGTFGERVRVQSKFAFKVPSSLPTLSVCPLMCAGVTVFNPLVKYSLGKGTRVGIVGIGGLGHLAVKFAKALGMHVTAISRGHSKKERAIALGADQFISSTSEEEMASGAKTCDIILFTAAGGSSQPFFSFLRKGGVLVQMGIPPVSEQSVETIPLVPFVFGAQRYASSLVGGSAITQQMLELCAQHNITSEGEVHPISDLPSLMQDYHTDASKAPFRWIFTTSAYQDGM